MARKKIIDAKDIQRGDVIRWERKRAPGDAHAIEYVASRDADSFPEVAEGVHYLLERNVAFKDGDQIWRYPEYAYHCAVRVRGDWLGCDNENKAHWFDDEWAKRKLAAGWVRVEPGK